MSWRRAKGGDSERQRLTFIGNAKATIDITDPTSTSVHFDLQKKVTESEWQEWETTLVGSDDIPGVEGVTAADREDPLAFTITLGRYFKSVGMAKKAARETTEALHLKLTRVEVKRPSKDKG